MRKTTKPLGARLRTASMLLLVLATMVAVAAGAAGCRREAAEPETAEELAVSLFGTGRPGSEDPGIYEMGLSASGEFTVLCRFGVVTPKALSQCRAKLVEFFAAVFRFEDVKRVYVQMDFPFRDASGKITLEKGLTARLSRIKSGQIEWTTFNPRDLAKVCEDWWVDPRLE